MTLSESDFELGVLSVCYTSQFKSIAFVIINITIDLIIINN